MGLFFDYGWHRAYTKAMALTDLKRLMNTLLDSVRALPAVEKWLVKHPRIREQMQKRFTTKDFFGLPLTLLVAAFLYTLALLLGVVQDYIQHDPLMLADVRIANLLYLFRSDPWLRFFYFITLFAEAAVVVVFALIVTAVLWLKRQRVLVFTLWLTLISSEATTFLGKIVFHRERPDLLLRAITEDSFSFPSGHATSVAAFYGFFCYLIVRTNRSWAIRFITVFLTAILVFLVDLSRLYLGVHYLSDVLAGNLVGLAALLLSISLTEWLYAKRTVNAPPTLRIPELAFVFLCGVVGVSVLFAATTIPVTQKTKRPVQQIGMKDVPALFENGTLPRYTETVVGVQQEPANVIVIAPDTCVVDEITAGQWALADSISLRSAEKIGIAAFKNTEYPTAPMTPSFYDARPHDYGFEKQTDRKTVRSRHHARFWDTGYRTPEGTLYVGTVSLDTGLKWGIAHTISPDIDTERELFVSDLKASGVVISDSLMGFVSPTLGKNFSGDLFFTDGKAAFITLRACNQ